MRALITGGAGFIGSHFVRYMAKKHPESYFINLDKLSYAGDERRLNDIKGMPNYEFVKGDVLDLNFLTYLLMERKIDTIFHFAAESHVDNSIGDSLEFTKNNTLGTHTIIEAARINKIKKFVHISTDEVYGDIMEGSFKEDSLLCPNNPYSASKAAAEMIVMGYYKTYKMPIVMIRGNNVFGPHQFPEKIIPRVITDVVLGRKFPLHGDGSNIRTYIYVEEFVKALEAVYEKGKIGEAYNIGTNDEISNIQLVRKILSYMGKGDECIEFVPDRPFNDRRYSIDLTKLKNLGWTQEIGFDEGLKKTIDWYKSNPDWWLKFVSHLKTAEWFKSKDNWWAQISK